MKKFFVFIIVATATADCHLNGMLARPAKGVLASTLSGGAVRLFSSWRRGNGQPFGTDAESVVNDFATHIRASEEAALRAYLVDQGMDGVTAQRVAEQQAARIVERLRRAPHLIKAKAAEDVEEILAQYHAENSSAGKN